MVVNHERGRIFDRMSTREIVKSHLCPLRGTRETLKFRTDFLFDTVKQSHKEVSTVQDSKAQENK